MRSRRPALAAALVASLALAGTALSQGHDPATSVAPSTNSPTSTQASRQWHRFRGRVTQANSTHHWFRMCTSSRSVRIHTASGTNWGGCDWDDMDHGHRVDVRAYRQHHRWIAQRVQNRRGGGHDRWDH
jgi:hypothetical protein